MASNHNHRKYNIVAYDPKWKDMFMAESDILRFIFESKALAIEHVGSTAVPLLAGKPTIDILILVDDVRVADELMEPIETAGYQSLGEYVKKRAILFVKEQNDVRLYNVHIFQKDDPEALGMIKIRDYFKNNPQAVEEYGNLKLELFGKYPDDYESYRKHKDDWMEELLKKI